MAERLTLEQVAGRLHQLPDDEMVKLVDYRLRFNVRDFLPGLGRDGDSSDIFGDVWEMFKIVPEYQEMFDKLRKACTSLVNKWTNRDFAHIQRDSHAIGELFFLSARVNAKEAIPGIAKIAGDDQYARIFLEAEDLQSRALRALGGLLVNENQQVKDQYKPHFEAALELGRPVGLTTLCSFWPEERDSFVEKAKSKDDEQLNRVVENLDIVLSLF